MNGQNLTWLRYVARVIVKVNSMPVHCSPCQIAKLGKRNTTEVCYVVIRLYDACRKRSMDLQSALVFPPFQLKRRETFGAGVTHKESS